MLRAIATTVLAATFSVTGFAQDLQSSGLVFTVDGADLGYLPIAADPLDPNRAVTYTLEDNEISFVLADPDMERIYRDPFFCFDFTETSSSVLRLSVKDANEHQVVHGQALISALQYDLENLEIRLDPAAEAQCFYKGLATQEFGLFGIGPQTNEVAAPEDQLFGDTFMADLELDLTFEGLPDYVTPGEELSYDLVLTNQGDVTVDEVALQELFPSNADYFNASLSVGTWSCSATNDAVCPTATEDSAGSLRFKHLALPPGGELRFTIDRAVSLTSLLDATIDLYAGTVDGTGTVHPYDTAEGSMTVVGEGSSLLVDATEAVADGQDTAEITVTVVDSNQNPVPGETVELASDGGLGVTPSSGETNDDGQVVFTASTSTADDYTVSFTAGDLSGNGTVTFTAGEPFLMAAWATVNDAVADGSDTVEMNVYVEDEFENPVPAVAVDVVDNGGLSSLPTEEFTDSAGNAVFSATSTTVDSYTVEFSVSGLGTETVDVSFVPGDPDDLEFVEQPTDTLVGEVISPAVVVRVVDANGNWVSNDQATEVTLSLRQDGDNVQTIDTFAVENGEVVLDSLQMDTAGTGYLLRALGVHGDGTSSVEDSNTFDVLEPDALGVTLNGFESSYAPGATQVGTETAAFTYTHNAGDIEQIFNVFRVFDSATEEEIAAETYDALFVGVSYGPTGYEDYIRGLSGTTQENVVAPETVDVEVMFELEQEAPTGDYTLELSSYDVTGEDPATVSLENTGGYDVIDTASVSITVGSEP